MPGSNEAVYGLNIQMNIPTPGTPGYDPTKTDILTQMSGAGELQQRLYPGFSLYSPTRAFRLTFQQADGNVVLQCVNDNTLPNHGLNNNWSNQPESPADVGWVPVWSTRTDNQNAAYMDMQIDGNLVIYNGQGQAIWATNTQGNTLAFLRMQDDGNLVITSQQGQTLWASSTSALQAPGVNA